MKPILKLLLVALLVSVPIFFISTVFQQKEALRLELLETKRLLDSVQETNERVGELVIPKFRTYSRLHRQKEDEFRRMLDDYVGYHNRVTSGQVAPRYARCSLAHGYGNCWQQFVSCALYAMVSKRALLLTRRFWDKTNPFMNTLQLFYEPPPVLLFRENITELSVPLYGPDNETKWNQFSWLEKASTCANLEEAFGNAPYLGLSGVQGFDYFADHIRDNPNHQLLHKLPTNFYQILFDYFWKLKPEWQAEIDACKKGHFGKFTIGLQMRGNDAGGIHPLIPLDIFMQAGELLAADAPVPYDDVVFLIATPDKKAVQEAQAIYGTKKIVYFEGSEERGTAKGNIVSFLTMWLLGDCDDVVTSESSSYGTNAAARTGIVPVVCNHARVCYRRLTPQPCSYNPFPTAREDCAKGLNSTMFRYASVESHCGFFFRYYRDCVSYGCPDPHDSFPHRPLPPWPPNLCPLNETKAASE
eukprot:TRINITY_DN31653_c0_g1_i1.p1 TRINITY_DN31653_c0_g1~~TRINITY_DN31653_c0_g1_i1.p1  ORF type:complete len:480 (-),score=86.32 TRINITY_DN31653_c0_g1_i1:69-1484(-)